MKSSSQLNDEFSAVIAEQTALCAIYDASTPTERAKTQKAMEKLSAKFQRVKKSLSVALKAGR